MSVNKLWARFLNIFFMPKSELLKIRNETGMMGITYLLLVVICFFVGFSFRKYGANVVLTEALIWFTSVLLTSLGACALILNFKLPVKTAKVFKIIVFTIYPLLFFLAISNFINQYRLEFITAGLIYSVILLFLALKTVINARNSKAIMLTILITVCGVCANYIARVLIP